MLRQHKVINTIAKYRMVENLNEGKEKKRLAPVLHFFLSDTVI